MKRIRRSLLYVPGNQPALVLAGGIFGADAVVFDLEDSVTVREKDAARILVRQALAVRSLITSGAPEIMVRINGLDTPFGLPDLEMIVPARPDSIRLPKAETRQQILDICALLAALEQKAGLPNGHIELVPILESVRGVANAREIANAHPRVTGLTLGAEDFTRDLGAARTREGTELAVARGHLVLAAKEAGIAALDTVFGAVNDLDGLAAECKLVRGLGFDGKSVIHPSQIPVVHEVFTPSAHEINHALRVRHAMREAERAGTGVVALDGRMIDAPVAKRAENVLAFAAALGLVPDEQEVRQ